MTQREKIEKILTTLSHDQRHYNQVGNDGWNEEIEKAITQIERLITEAEKTEVSKTNELLRSMYHIACREYALGGENTNWSPFIDKLGEQLERQHKIMYPEQLQASLKGKEV